MTQRKLPKSLTPDDAWLLLMIAKPAIPTTMYAMMNGERRRYLSVSQEMGIETTTAATNGGATRMLDRAPVNPKLRRIMGLG